MRLTLLLVAVAAVFSLACTKTGGGTGAGKMVNRGSVQEVLARHQKEVQSCYEKGLMGDGNLAGSLAVEFFYNRGGHVTECQVRRHLADETVGECVCAAVQKWLFSSSFEASNRVNYTWDLKPREAKIEVGIAPADLEVIKKNQGVVVKCYEAALKKNRSLKGPLGVALHLTQDGSVGRCELKQNLEEEPSVGACVCEGIQSWKFAPPEKPNKVLFYTWNLQPQTEK